MTKAMSLQQKVDRGELDQGVADLLMRDDGLDSVKLSSEETRIRERMDYLKNLCVSTWRDYRHHLIFCLSKNHSIEEERLARMFRLS